MKEAMNFLYENLPESDLDCYSADLFRQFAEHALMLRKAVPWCAALEQELFDHYVLFPRVNDEDLSFHRQIFFDALWPRIQVLDSMEDQILAVNCWCSEMACYQMQDDRTASPLTVFRNGSGRCGEESAFLVAALRSVGIPARQVYAPRWAHCDDNHAWVEAWCDGTWRFLGACEPEPVLGRGWFNTPASRALLVHSRVFGKAKSAVHGEFLYKESGISWYNQTSRYAITKKYRFTVMNGEAPATGAKVHIQVLNESSFHTVATLTADAKGQAHIELGLGDFHVLATMGDLVAEADCTGEDMVLRLQPVTMQSTDWQHFDVRAPKSSKVNPSELSDVQKRCRVEERKKGDLIREKRIQQFYAFAGEHPRWQDMLELARGNGEILRSFLEEDSNPDRERLLRTLSRKDLRDVTMEVLNDHLHHRLNRDGIPEDVFRAFVLCPRIEWEPLRPWRSALRDALTQQQKSAFRAAPATLWTYLTERISLKPERIYANLCWTPAECWHAGRSDERSLKLLFVAMLRTLGIPARLRPLDGAPEYWQEGVFHTVCQEETGVLYLNCDQLPAYRQNWTLLRWTGTEWKLLNLPEGESKLQLPTGKYRLITSQRMPNGNQYAAMRDLVIKSGETVCTDLCLRTCTLQEMLGSQELPPMRGITLDGEEVSIVTDKPSLLLWVEEGAEPTEHLLIELMELEELPMDVTVLVRNREGINNATLAKLLEQWPGIRVILDDWYFDLEAVARCLTCDPDTPPLAVICDARGQAVFGASGYRVGMGKLLADIAKILS